MTSSSAPSPPIKLHVPAIASWISLDSKEAYLGVQHDNTSLTFTLHVDEVRNICSCRLRIPVWTKSSDKKTWMYLLFEPRQTSSLETRIDHIPHDVANCFVMGRHCSSSDDIVALDVSLVEPAGIVGPKAATEPRSLPMRNVVAQLISLGQTDHITIYISPGTIDARRRLLELPAVFRKWSAPCDSVVSTLYAGKGGRMLHSMDDLLGPLVAGGHASEQDTCHLGTPPAYHRVTPESSQALLSKRRQRLQSPSHEQPPQKKQDREHPEKVPLSISPAYDEVWRRAFAEQLAFLTAKVTSLEEERRTPQTADAGVQTDEGTHATDRSANRASPHPSTCSTVGDSLEDRLTVAEHQISAIRGDMIRLRDSFRFTTSKPPESLISTFSQTLDSKVSDILQAYESLSDEVDGLRAGVAEDVQDLLDDMLSGIKLEMRDYANDEMENVEKRLFDRVRAVIGRARLSIKLDDNDDTDE